MTAGIHIINDHQSVQISSGTIPMVYQRKIRHNLRVENMLSLRRDHGGVSVYVPPSDTSRIMEYGIFQPFGTDHAHILKDRIAGDLFIDEYIFEPKIQKSTNIGMQLFDENGTEIFNSDSLPLVILGRASINLADTWNNYKSYSFFSDVYQKTKLGFLFTNLPSGITKSPSMAEIWAYDYRFFSGAGSIGLAIKPNVWSYSWSNANIPINYDLKAELFVIDLSHIPD